MEFPIVDQAQFDQAISERLQRERAKFSDYDDLKKKVTSADAALQAARDEAKAKHDAELKKFSDYDDLKTKVADFEKKDEIAALKADVSKTTGVPVDALAGSTKEELEAHAAVLKQLLNSGPVVPDPGKTPTNSRTESDALDAVRQLFGSD